MSDMSKYIYAPGGVLEIYGVDAQRHCRANNPLTSFDSRPLPDNVLAGFGYYPVRETAPQYNPDAQIATDAAELQEDGTWLQMWSYRDLTEEEIAARQPQVVHYTTAKPLRLRMALAQLGLMANIQSWLATQNEAVTTAWASNTEDYVITAPIVEYGAAQSGITPEQLQEAFDLANEIHPGEAPLSAFGIES